MQERGAPLVPPRRGEQAAAHVASAHGAELLAGAEDPEAAAAVLVREARVAQRKVDNRDREMTATLEAASLNPAPALAPCAVAVLLRFA